MALLEPTALKLKTQLLASNQILGREARLQELDQIASYLITAYNETESALSSKIGGTGHRSFGGTATVTGDGSNQGLVNVPFSHALPSADYEVYMAPYGGTDPNPDYFGYIDRTVDGFDIQVITLVSGDTTDFFWFVVY